MMVSLLSGGDIRAEFRSVAMEKLLLYLKVMKKRIIAIDETNGRIDISDNPPDMPDVDVKVGIRIIDSWIRIFCLIKAPFTIEELGPSAADVLFGLLRLQDDYAEFNFGISRNNELVVKADIYIPALTLDVFMEEYYGVLNAYAKFMTKILPILKEGKMGWREMMDIW